MKKEDKTDQKLENLPKNNPFSVPDNYFRTFPQRLKERLPETGEEPVIPLSQSVKKVFSSRFALAAAIAGFIILGYIGFLTLSPPDIQMAGDNAIAEYIDLYHYEFSDQQLIGLLLEDGEYLEGEFYFDSPDLYIDYLYNEDIDIELILTEF